MARNNKSEEEWLQATSELYKKLNLNDEDIRTLYKIHAGCSEQQSLDSSLTNQNQSGRCGTEFNIFICWPSTLEGNRNHQYCPDIDWFDPTKMAWRECSHNSTWNKSNYSSCLRTLESHEPTVVGTTAIYTIGFFCSIAALLVAIGIFFHFKKLWCLRNAIHCNLMGAILLHNLTHVTTLYLPRHVSEDNLARSIASVTALYLMCTTFYWMFVEGLYIFIIIVWPFTAGKIKLWFLLIIGWLLPAVPLTVWLVLVLHRRKEELFIRELARNNYTVIFNTPIEILLTISVFFIIFIIWVLVTKLRASQTLERRQFVRAVKTIIVLLPLMGTTYIFFYENKSGTSVWVVLYRYTQAVLISFQGLVIAILYCFLNGEVRSVVKHRIVTLQDSRTLSGYTKSFFFRSQRRSTFAMTNATGKLSKRSSANGTDRHGPETTDGRLGSDVEDSKESCFVKTEQLQSYKWNGTVNADQAEMADML